MSACVGERVCVSSLCRVVWVCMCMRERERVRVCMCRRDSISLCNIRNITCRGCISDHT